MRDELVEYGNKRIRPVLLGAIILFGLFIVAVVLWFSVLPYTVNESRLGEAVAIAKSRDLEHGHCFNDRRDWYGSEICVSKIRNEEKTAIIYTAISAGKDGKYATKDDHTRSLLDFNKSKLVGKWIGEKSVQFVKGIKEGVSVESKHDK